MNQANKIKMMEKKFKIFFLTFFSIIKKHISAFFRFILNIGNQKITIMFIPHSEKKVVNLRINAFILFTVLFVSFSIMFVIFYLTFDNYNQSCRDKNASIMMQLSEKRSREYEDLINQILEKHSVFSTKLELLLSQLNSNTIKAMKESNALSMNQGGPLNKLDMGNINEFETEKLQTNKLINDYNYSIQAFSEINKMANNYNKLLKDLPFGTPLNGPYIFTSGFGFRIHPINKVLDMHTGIDLAWAPGTPILATAPGIVEKVEWNPEGYGWYCKLSHNLGFSTLYGHMRSQPIVRPGERVRKGQLLGYMGRTGAATGVHVHYEIRLGDNLLDPWKFVVAY